MLQHGWTYRTLHKVKEARHKGPHVTWSLSHEMYRKGKSIETESRLGDDENVLKLDGGDGCAGRWVF